VVATDDGHVVASSTVFHHRDLSVKFFGDVDEVLAKAGVTFDDITTLAVGMGPGSFTGVRVAVTTFRTLAQATGKRLVGVGTLPLFAYDALQALPPGAAVIALLPSRRGEVYGAVYDTSGEMQAPFAATFTELAAKIDDLRTERSVVTVGPTDVLPAGFANVEQVVCESPSPAAFAVLASAEVAAERWADPMALNPIYVVAPAISQHKDPRTTERLNQPG
jgi:tRNA threonylcarbamoyladenosine biosynthesis protein TsaB